LAQVWFSDCLCGDSLSTSCPHSHHSVMMMFRLPLVMTMIVAVHANTLTFYNGHPSSDAVCFNYYNKSRETKQSAGPLQYKQADHVDDWGEKNVFMYVSLAQDNKCDETNPHKTTEVQGEVVDSYVNIYGYVPMGISAPRDMIEANKVKVLESNQASVLFMNEARNFTRCTITSQVGSQTATTVGRFAAGEGGSATFNYPMTANLIVAYTCDGEEVATKTVEPIGDCDQAAIMFTLVGIKGSTDYAPEIVVITGRTCSGVPQAFVSGSPRVGRAGLVSVVALAMLGVGLRREMCA